MSAAAPSSEYAINHAREREVERLRAATSPAVIAAAQSSAFSSFVRTAAVPACFWAVLHRAAP
jgi:hypothetical protein